VGFWFLAVLILLLFVAVPWWPYSRGWGYWPGGGILVLLLAWLFIIWIGWTAFYMPWEAPPPSRAMPPPAAAPGPAAPAPAPGVNPAR
jgi:hypothetical protein